MQIKIFSSISPTTVEQDANAWLAENSTITFVSATQSSASPEPGVTRTILTIFYEQRTLLSD